MDVELHRPIRWIQHKRLGMVISIQDTNWLKEHKADMDEWLESEGRGNFLESRFHTFKLFLYSEKQMAYFALRWPQ